MDQLMLDIETLGMAPDGVILSVGATEFEFGEMIHSPRTFYERVNFDSALAYGMKIDYSTVRWWRMAVFDPGQKFYSLVDVLDLFKRRFQWDRFKGVWTNVPTFDFAILRRAYQLTHLGCPWGHRQERCSQTLMQMALEQGFQNMTMMPARDGTHHHALEDAQYQAEVARKLHKFLFGDAASTQ